MEVMYTFNANNGYFAIRQFIGFSGEVSDLEVLVDNLENVILSNKKVKKFISYNKDYFDCLDLDKSILNKRYYDLSYCDKKLVMLLYSVIKNPKVIILNYCDIGFNYKYKRKISKFIKLVNATLGTSFVILSNDVIFLSKCVRHFIVCNNGIIRFQGNLIDAINSDYLDKPPIIDFIERANKVGAKLDYTLDNKELLKSIYRSVF